METRHVSHELAQGNMNDNVEHQIDMNMCEIEAAIKDIPDSENLDPGYNEVSSRIDSGTPLSPNLREDNSFRL